jgi:hypothetical protein
MNRTGGISLLDWPLAVSEATITRPKFRTHAKIPELRIVSEVRKDDLFKYAITAKSATGFWETVVYAAMALGAVGALALAFGI